MDMRTGYPEKPTFLHNICIALLVFGSTELSRLLGFETSNISLFWPPTSIALIFCLRRGWQSLFGSLSGLLIWLIYNNQPAGTIFLYTAGTAITSVIGVLALKKLAQRQPLMGITLSLGNVMLVCVGIVAPIAATIGSIVMKDHEIALANRFDFWVGYWMVEAISAAMFVPALIHNIPAIASHQHFYRSPAIAAKVRANDVWRILGVALASSITLYLAIQGNTNGALLMLVLMIPLCFLMGLSASLQGSSVLMMLGAATILTVHAKLTGQQLTVETQASTLRIVLLVFESLLVSHFSWSFFAEREQQALKLRGIAHENEISGLPNRRAVLRALNETQTTGTLTLIEIQIRDLFRWIELGGYDNAAKIEQTLGERIRSSLGDTATIVGHIGTGRYFICVPGTLPDTYLEDTLRKAIDLGQFSIGDQTVSVRSTMGVIDVPSFYNTPFSKLLDDSKTLAEHFLHASALVTQDAINSGAGMMRRQFSQQQAQERRQELEKIESIKQSVAKQRIRLLAQPIVATQAAADGGQLHYEILCRMLDDQGVEQPPSWFLPVIARARLSKEFDRAVLKTSFEYLASNKGLRNATAKCSINVTGYSLSDPSFSSYVIEQLAATGLSGKLIVIEVTESDSISNFDLATQQLRQLAAHGIGCAVDDFGVGLATFDYVKKLRPNWLKIDGSFVMSIGQTDADPLDTEIIIAAVRAAKAIGASTVAEHVETEHQIDVLKALGVDYLQGYALSKPVRIETLVEHCSAFGLKSGQKTEGALRINLPQL
jgi:EAL domain-containing protein (putative c-di-GMP-specific phosphodiesterase class I)/integral membrane sensor domain MASE1/GGDEF domain-containing protein